MYTMRQLDYLASKLRVGQTFQIKSNGRHRRIAPMITGFYTSTIIITELERRNPRVIGDCSKYKNVWIWDVWFKEVYYNGNENHQKLELSKFHELIQTSNVHNQPME